MRRIPTIGLLLYLCHFLTNGVAHDVSHAFACFRMRVCAFFVSLRLCVLNYIFVKLIANLMPKSGGTFQKFSSPPPNIASTRVSKFRGICDFYFTYPPTSLFSGIYKRRLLSLPLGRAGVGPRKALPALQRGPYCIATGLPLHHNNGPVADQGGPYGRKTRLFPVIFRRSKINKIHASEKPGGPYGTPTPSIRMKKRAGNHRDRCQNGPKMSKNERFSEQDFVRKFITQVEFR